MDTWQQIKAIYKKRSAAAETDFNLFLLLLDEAKEKEKQLYHELSDSPDLVGYHTGYGRPGWILLTRTSSGSNNYRVTHFDYLLDGLISPSGHREFKLYAEALKDFIDYKPINICRSEAAETIPGTIEELTKKEAQLCFYS